MATLGTMETTISFLLFTLDTMILLGFHYKRGGYAAGAALFVWLSLSLS